MKSIKEIIEEYEVTRATLHNWKNTKPKLYQFLRNANSNDDQLRELSIVLAHYEKEVVPRFTCKEVTEVIKADLALHSAKETLEIAYLFLHAVHSQLPSAMEKFMPIYTKLSSLNPVEKYLFKTALKSVEAKQGKEPLDALVRHYFKIFIVKE
jgi:hypothetical protein